MTTDKDCKRHWIITRLSSWQGAVVLIILAALSYYLVSEHGAHLIAALPYLILLICPLMHLFHGHGHGKHEDKEEGD